jgi:hypothetical protein
MALEVKKAEYYQITVSGRLAEASQMLSAVADAGVDFLAYRSIPIDPQRTRFTFFPADGSVWTSGAQRAGLRPDGPHCAIILTGDEKPGALAEIFRTLSAAGIRVEESSGMAHIHGGYGVVLYLQPEECEKAMAVLNQ